MKRGTQDLSIVSFLFCLIYLFAMNKAIGLGSTSGVTACWFALDVFEQTLCIILMLLHMKPWYKLIVILSFGEKCILQISNLWSGSRISWIVFISFISYFFSFLQLSPKLSPFREVHFHFHFFWWNSHQPLERKGDGGEGGGFDVKEKYFYKCGNKSLSFNPVAACVCETDGLNTWI